MICLNPIMESYKPIAVFIVLSCLFTLHLNGQESSTSKVNNQLWLDFNPKWILSDRLEFRGKIGAKSSYPKVWYKFYTTTEISYWIPKSIFKKLKYNERVYIGIDLYYVAFIDLPDVIEISPYQGYTLTWPNRKRLVLRHNVELGQRFQWDIEEWNYSFGLKLTYEASMIYNFHGDIWKHGKGFFLSVSAKFWWNLIATTIFNDVIRITPGIGYRINPKWRTAFYIGYNLVRNQSVDQYQTNNIIYRLRVHYTIPRKAKK